MEPVRRVQTATHFKRISAPSSGEPKIIKDDWLMPCSPGYVLSPLRRLLSVLNILFLLLSFSFLFHTIKIIC